MVQSAQKILILCIVVSLAVMPGTASAVGGAEQQQQVAKSPQPQALDAAGVYALKQLAPNLTGSGVNFAVICRSITYIDGEPQNDYRPNTEHNCFRAGQFSFHDQNKLPPGISPHSTAICSILFGTDPNAFNQQLGQFDYQGIAPQAKADVYEFWHFLINNVFPGSPADADILTVGIGSQFEDWWTRGIESLAEHYGLIIVAGIGNGSDSHDPLLYPAAGANVIGVGVVDSVKTERLATNLAHFALAYPQHSSFGPTEDHRCKPDIVAPGNCLVANVSEHTCYEPTGSWSSFSMPITAGTVGLLVQKAKEDPNLSSAVSPEGGNCVMKAILMNSARKLPYWHKGRLEKDDDHTAPLDYIQGAGMLNALEAYKHLIAGQNKPGDVPTTGWDLNQLCKSETLEHTYRIAITKPADEYITATVVWNRHYSSVYPFESACDEDADLRLELWAIDTNDPNNNYLLDYSDSNVDNVEHIYSPADANYANYEIVVSYSNTDGPSRMSTMQRYGLAWNISKPEDSDNIFRYDLNADGIVNEPDFVILLNNIITTPEPPESYPLGDINSDGVIDVNDFQTLMNHRNLKADWHK